MTDIGASLLLESLKNLKKFGLIEEKFLILMSNILEKMRRYI